MLNRSLRNIAGSLVLAIWSEASRETVSPSAKPVSAIQVLPAESLKGSVLPGLMRMVWRAGAAGVARVAGAAEACASCIPEDDDISLLPPFVAQPAINRAESETANIVTNHFMEHLSKR